ncbi:MAG: hypothetical protein JWP61_55 [Friedmanniella sp.]|nr:hypothetical protein [Friedmanniella sp.]
MDIRIGISGWTYPAWRGTFYPVGLPHRRELEYVSRRLNSLEVNGSFYSLQRPSSYRAWAAAAPEDFVFALKGSRFLSHMKKLAEPHSGLATFFASGLLALGPRLGPILWQLPPTMAYDRERLDGFLRELPRTAEEAAVLARDHDGRLAGDRVLTETEHPAHPLRYALEVRHDSFRTPELAELLREHGVALVMADNPGQWPVLDEHTTDFRYVRLHGHDDLYASGYDEPALAAWAERIRGWVADGDDVYVYCDNDAKVRAPYDAMGLMAQLGVLPAGHDEVG